MRKVAIFVEGQSELIFVREFLLQWFNYNVDIECFALRTGDAIYAPEYPFPNTQAPLHFQIINANSDIAVLTQIFRHEQQLYNAGYEIIIGLRDMFSEAYIKTVKNRTINLSENALFREGVINTIRQKAVNAEAIRFCFAIMEIEAWWLGIPTLWADLEEPVRKQFGDAFADPESVFHPAVLIKNIQQSRQKDYTKHNTEVESIVGKISREDYVELHDSRRCPSFCEFVGYIQPQLN